MSHASVWVNLMSNNFQCRLYLLSPPQLDDLKGFAQNLEDALSQGGVACFQLRLKTPEGDGVTDEQVLAAAEALLPVAAKHGVPFLLNDRPDLAKQVGADGVHIGQKDASYEAARALLGKEASIGVTCHNSRHLALEAGEAGADYVAFGAFFPTATKAPPSFAEASLLTWWQDVTTVPCVAIGGINAGNCADLATAGADFVAVSSGVWDHPGGVQEGVKSINAALSNAVSNK